MGTGASSARDCALITVGRTPVIHAWWVTRRAPAKRGRGDAGHPAATSRCRRLAQQQLLGTDFRRRSTLLGTRRGRLGVTLVTGPLVWWRSHCRLITQGSIDQRYQDDRQGLLPGT